MTRREFLKYIGYSTLYASLFGALDICSLAGCGSGKFNPQTIPPSFIPATTEEKTMSAFIDTVLPGYASDPEGSPGALEAGALTVLFDRSYPTYAFIPIATALLNNEAQNSYNKAFYELDLNSRTSVLSIVEKQLAYISLLIQFVEGAFYLAFVNDVGYQYMGYPGANLGYVDQGFSFNTQMSQELTNDGNLP